MPTAQPTASRELQICEVRRYLSVPFPMYSYYSMHKLYYYIHSFNENYYKTASGVCCDAHAGIYVHMLIPWLMNFYEHTTNAIKSCHKQDSQYTNSIIRFLLSLAAMMLWDELFYAF